MTRRNARKFDRFDPLTTEVVSFPWEDSAEGDWSHIRLAARRRGPVPPVVLLAPENIEVDEDGEHMEVWELTLAGSHVAYIPPMTLSEAKQQVPEILSIYLLQHFTRA